MSVLATDDTFQFKKFVITQRVAAQKVGTDGVLLGAWVDVTDVRSALDIGTGTGLIALMLAQRLPQATITAVEIESAAAAEATANMQATPWAERLSVVEQSVQDFARASDVTFDLIVCNPPFFTGGALSPTRGRDTARHTIKLPNGDLLQAARRLLTPRGSLCVILPKLEGLRFKDMAGGHYGLHCTRMTEVYGKADKSIERLLLEFSKQSDAPMHTDRLDIRDKSGDYSNAYRDLTSDFYVTLK